MKIQNRVMNLKLVFLTASVVFLSSLILVYSSEVYAHSFYHEDPKEPKMPPPPPPPCQNYGYEIDFSTNVSRKVVGKDDCGKDLYGNVYEVTAELRKVCLDGGTRSNVSYRTGYEAFVREDLMVNGVYPISIKRQYMSNSSYDSSLGYGWSFNHDLRLFEYPDGSVVVRTGCGVNYKFVYTGTAYQAEVGTDVLTKNISDNSFDLTYLNGARDHFDSQGRLVDAWDTRGNRLEYLYSPNKMPLIGSSPYGVDPARPVTVAYIYQLTQIRERLASGSLSGNNVIFNYNTTTGRVEGIASNDGRVISYIHDDAGAGKTKGNLIQVNGLEGVVSTFKYEDVVDKIADPWVYKDHHNVTEIKHTSGSESIILEYDVAAEDRVVKETIGYQEFTFDWTASPLRTKVTETVKDDIGENPVSVIREYAFDDYSYINEFIDGFGNKASYTNDANGNSTKIVLEENQGTLAAPIYVEVRTIDATYATNGDKLTETIALDNGEIHSYTWDYDQTRLALKTANSTAIGSIDVKTENIFNYGTDGKPTTVQARRRYLDNGTDFLETSYTYNANGNVITTTLPDNHVIVNEYGSAYGGRYVTKTYHQIAGLAVTDLEESYEYDDKGNRTKVTDARGNFTATIYDDKNRRTSTVNMKGHLTTFIYDANDNLTQIIRDRTSPADQLDITKLTYDSKNQLTRIDRIDSGGVFVKRSTMRYDSTGNVIARGDANDIETTMVYDLENRLTRITDDEGNYIEYTLNALGHRVATNYYKTGGVVVRTSNAVFDDLNRQEQVIGSINQTTTYTYDVQGNRITATDALGRPTTIYSYDSLSRLKKIKDANGIDTVYDYDNRYQLRFVTDPRGLQTEYQYNELGQLTKLISPDTSTTEYTYDLVGNRKSQKDARSVTVTFDYDQLNRITNKTYTDTSLDVVYTYDTGPNSIGKLSAMTDKEGVTTYDYDTRGNLNSRSRVTDGDTYLTQYGYDINDRMTSATYPSLRVVTYVRNDLGQVTSVTTTASGGSQVTIASNLNYLPFGALEDMDWGNGLSLDQTFDNDYRLTNQVLGTKYSRDYIYDDVNNIKNINDNISATKNQTFNYDVLDRLDDATGVYGSLDYGYDDVGNRTALTVDTDPAISYNYSPTANQLDDIDGAAITYDNNGNTKTKDALTFDYDENNRMSQVGDGAVTTSYGFNGKGERVRKTSAGVSNFYHYDSSGNLLFESDASGNATVEYIWLGSQRLAMAQGVNLYYTHVDHLGSVQLLTDSAGGVVWSADYKPFGEVNIISAVVENNLRFPGQYYDGESGLHYNYFRDYDPGIGRYVESDPIGLGGGLNTYVYVANSPYVFIDQSGLIYKYIGDFMYDAACLLLTSKLQGKIDGKIDSLNLERNKLFDRAGKALSAEFDECKRIDSYCRATNVHKPPCEKLDCAKSYNGCVKRAYHAYNTLSKAININIDVQIELLRNQHWLLNFACPPTKPKY